MFFTFRLKGLLLAASLCAAAGYAEATTLCTPDAFGGYPSRVTLNTKAIQSAIDHCALQGGGEVRLRKGFWLSGPLTLKSHVTLNLMEGAILKADNREKDFVAAYIGSPTQDKEAFILANGETDVGIIGSGIIDGSGEELWWEEALRIRKEVRSGNTKLFEELFPNVKLANGMPRPWLIELNEVTGATVFGVTLTNSPMWNLVLRNSEDIVVDSVTISAPEESPNTDGMDIVSSQRVTVRNVEIATGDNNIAIKSGVNKDGSQSSAEILIENSVMNKGHGISLGSETANGIGKVTVRNVTFNDGENGVRIKSARDRGAEIGPLYVEDVTMHNVATPLLVTLSYAGQAGAAGLDLTGEMETEPVTAFTPLVKGVHVTNLKATGAQLAALLSGLPEAPLKEVVLENVQLEAKQGIQARYVEGSLIFTQVECEAGPAVNRGAHALLKEAR